jgi:hypothetical protein
MQRRSLAHKQRAVQLMRDGAIGKIYLAKGVVFKRRQSIGRQPDGPTPPGVDWDLFLGPAPMRAFNPLRFRYNWHWFWDTGNGEIGNQGIHEMDMARWGLGRGLPSNVVSTGGKYVYDDDQETPNTQVATFDYGDAMLEFEVRGLPTNGEADFPPDRGHYIGNLYLGSKGFLSVDHTGFKIFLGDKREPGESMKAVEPPDQENVPHMTNFLQVVKSRKRADLHAGIEEGATSAVLVHMANISYRTKRRLDFDAASMKFLRDDEANRLMTRHPYRAPYVVA